MSTGPLLALKPNVTKEEALRAFSGSGLSGLYSRLRRGPLQRIADVYVQYYLFRVETGSGKPRFFAIDAIDGSLDLFEFQRVPEEHEMLPLDGRNRMPATLAEDRAIELVRDKVLRVMFQQGFFKVRDVRLEIVREQRDLHLPYWLGFYGQDGAVRCRVMDAVRRRMEGAKAIAFFEQWLAA
jgi:hypothetical protein